jgi:hypothetical protein
VYANSAPKNSDPLSKMHWVGLGYLHNHVFSTRFAHVIALQYAECGILGSYSKRTFRKEVNAIARRAGKHGGIKLVEKAIKREQGKQAKLVEKARESGA